MPGARILIVEDENLAAGEYARILRDLDYTIAGNALSGEEALRVLMEARPDLVIMDIELQGAIDGIETAEQMREQTDVPVVFLSTHSDLPSIRRAIHSQAYGYVIKPVSREHLYTAIETALQRHRLEKRLAQSEARYRAIVEDQTELICRCLPDGTLTFVNGAFCRFFNRTLDALIGQSFTSAVPREDRVRLETALAALSTAKPVCTVEHRVSLDDGQQHWQQWTYRAISREQGGIIEYQLVGRDITERKRAEQNL
ncbi:MAG: response regulator, partial [Spirochaetes bacterium]